MPPPGMIDDGPPLGVYIIFTVFAAFILISWIAHCVSQEGGDDLLGEHEPLLIRRTASIEAAVEERRAAQGRRNQHGSPVYFSRHRVNGEVKQLALLAGGRKFALRRLPAGFECIRQRRSVASEKRSAVLGQPQPPERGNANGYIVVLIGWTTLGSDEIDDILHSTLQMWGVRADSLLPNNRAMPFLQALADGFVIHHADDWDWFSDHREIKDVDHVLEPTRPMVALAQEEWGHIRTQQEEERRRRNNNNNDWIMHASSTASAPAPDPPAMSDPPPPDPPSHPGHT